MEEDDQLAMATVTHHICIVRVCERRRHAGDLSNMNCDCEGNLLLLLLDREGDACAI